MLLAAAVITTAVAWLARRSRWARAARLTSRCAYAALLLQAALYFPMRAGFALAAPMRCEWTFGLPLAVHSLRNYPHIVLFALFFLLTYAQLRDVPRGLLWSTVICMTMGVWVELAQGATGAGHCRMRDLIPDAVGVAIGAALLAGARKLQARKRAPLLIAALFCVNCAERVPNRPMNFGVVEPPSATNKGMYRGGKPSPAEIVALRRELQVRTMVRLARGDASAERAAARLADIELIEIPLNPKLVGSSDPATRAAVERAFAAFADPRNAPVYLYCDHGRDRTGYVVGLYRARMQRWPVARIREELARYGHGALMRRYLPHISRQLAREVDAQRGRRTAAAKATRLRRETGTVRPEESTARSAPVGVKVSARTASSRTSARRCARANPCGRIRSSSSRSDSRTR